MGESCRHRGLDVVPVNGTSIPAGVGDFDVILMSDVLHLVEHAESVLRSLRGLLKPGGQLVARIPNLNDVRVRRRRMVDARFKKRWNREAIGATPFTPRDLRSLAKRAGFAGVEIASKPTKRFEKMNRISLGLFSNVLSPHLYLKAVARP
jgi:SAM-dependent methyltransferase